MDTVVDLLKVIPDVVWSGLLGALLALAGVLVSNRGNSQRLKTQLAHDAKEKAIERIATLRREVYLRTAEELVKANAHLASLPTLDLATTNLGDGLQGFFGAAARLQLVAEPSTALLVNKLAARYGELIFKVMGHLLPASYAKTDIRIADDLYNKAQAEVARVLSELSKLNESGSRDDARFRALNTIFDFQSTQSKKYASDSSNGWSRFNTATHQYHRFLLHELRDIASMQVPILIAIRQDLGLSGDLAELEAEMNSQREKMQKHFDQLLKALSDA